MPYHLATAPYSIITDPLTDDSNGNRTRVTAVKGRCLNRLTMEPDERLHVALTNAIIPYLAAFGKGKNNVTGIFFYNRVCYNSNIVTKTNRMEESEIDKNFCKTYERKGLDC